MVRLSWQLSTDRQTDFVRVLGDGSRRKAEECTGSGRGAADAGCVEPACLE